MGNTGMVHVQELTSLVQTFVTGIYMQNLGTRTHANIRAQPNTKYKYSPNTKINTQSTRRCRETQNEARTLA